MPVVCASQVTTIACGCEGEVVKDDTAAARPHELSH